MSKKALARVVVPFVLKAAADKESRTFEGLAATWDQDQGNDVIHKGAFKSSLTEWKAGDTAMPLLNSHNHFDIFAAIGQMVDGKETKDGLFTKWEVIEGPDGDKVMDRLRPSKSTGKPLIGKMSIGFIPTKFSFEQPEGTDSFFDRVRHISEAQLKEVSLVLFPMNDNASIDASSVKMFVKQLLGTDPRKLSRLDQMELRKLASRIGMTLQKVKGTKIEAPDDEDELEDDDELTDDPPETPDDSTDDESDESDDESSDPPDDESSDDPPPDPPLEGSKGTYQMSEALAQRLQSTLLRAKTSDLRNQQ